MSLSYRHDLLTAAAKVLATMAAEQHAAKDKATNDEARAAYASREQSYRDLASVLADVALATP